MLCESEYGHSAKCATVDGYRNFVVDTATLLYRLLTSFLVVAAAAVVPAAAAPPPYRLDNPAQYLSTTYLGQRTAGYQASLGCRYRCTFCGVAAMFRGKTAVPPARRLEEDLQFLTQQLGVDAIQFYDHNFFDREETSVPVLEVLARLQMPWWCYARSDALARFRPQTWELIRKSRLRMTYIGAEAASDDVLNRMRKGSRVDHTLEVAALCRAHDVIPEFSFVLGGPEDPEGEIEKTLSFIRRLKGLHPACEIILYFYSPTPQIDRAALRNRPGETHLPVLKSYGPSGPALPSTPEEWTEPRWISWVCHQDAPWLTPRLRQRVLDFARVLACRFPTVQDHRTPEWGKTLLRNLARRKHVERELAKEIDSYLSYRLTRRFAPDWTSRDCGVGFAAWIACGQYRERQPVSAGSATAARCDADAARQAHTEPDGRRRWQRHDRALVQERCRPRRACRHRHQDRSRCASGCPAAMDECRPMHAGAHARG